MVTGRGKTGQSPSIERATAILDALSHGPLGLAELAQRARLAKSSVSDICSTLVGTDLVRRGPDDTYRLGGRLPTMARQMAGAPALVDAFLRTTVAGTVLDGHTLSLGKTVGNEMLTLNVRLGRHPLPLTPRPGTRVGLLDCAAGPAIAAALGDRLDAELDLFASHQHVDVGDRAAIHDAAQQAAGHRVSTWRSRSGVMQLACPVGGEYAQHLMAVTVHLPDDPHFKLGIAALSGGLTNLTDRLG